MKITFLLFLALCLGLAGCDTVRDDVRERFSPPQYLLKKVKVEQKKAYDAALVALKKMDYTFERGGPAQGLIHAIGPIDTSVNGPGTARQVWFDARFSQIPEEPGVTKVEILFSMLIEEDFNKHPGQGTLNAMRGSGLYEVFYGYFDEALAAKP